MAATAATPTRHGSAALSPLHFPPIPPPHAHRKRRYWTTLLAVLLAVSGWAVLEWTDPLDILSDLQPSGPTPRHTDAPVVAASPLLAPAAALPASVSREGGVADVSDREGAVTATTEQRVASFYAEAGNFRCPQPQRYTKAEVARHATEDDLWIVVDGNVLDVTGFSQQHPGGAVLVKGAGGHDLAAVFAHFHDPTSVSLFASFCIGQIRR